MRWSFWHPQWSFTLSDVQFSVVAVLDEYSVLRERVSYDAYGVGKHRWLADVDGDGDVDSADLDILWDHTGGEIGSPNATPSYLADADLDRDGVVDIFLDIAPVENFKSALAPEKISDAEESVRFGIPS